MVPVAERVDLSTAGERYLDHLGEVMQRKATTIQDYEIMLRRHLVAFFSGRSLDRIDPQLVAEYLIAEQRDGLSTKTVANQLTFLHGVFRYAMKKGWSYANPLPPSTGRAPPKPTPTSASSLVRRSRRCYATCMTRSSSLSTTRCSLSR
jgi:site-specific recombinase XerD